MKNLLEEEAGAKSFASNLTIHDPCTTRYEPDIQGAVRQLLREMGVIFEEMDLSRARRNAVVLED